MKLISITFGFFTTLLALALCAMVVATSCQSLAVASAAKVESYEATKRIEVAEREATERTRIVSDASVRIAEINADVSKKTSFFFSLFFLLRALICLAVIASALWVAVFVREKALGSFS